MNPSDPGASDPREEGRRARTERLREDLAALRLPRDGASESEAGNGDDGSPPRPRWRRRALLVAFCVALAM